MTSGQALGNITGKVGICRFCGVETSDWVSHSGVDGSCVCRGCRDKPKVESVPGGVQLPLSLSTSHILPSGDDRGELKAHYWKVHCLGDDYEPEPAVAEKAEKVDAIYRVLDKPEPAVVEFWDGASLATVRREKSVIKRLGGGLRGKVREFTRNSARRLKRTIAKIRGDRLPYFVTLTFADTYPYFEDPARWKRELKVFAQRLGRSYPGVSFVWRLEMAVRKSGVFEGEPRPHFHLLVYGVKNSQFLEFRQWVADAWYDITNTGVESHIRTQVQRIHSRCGVMSYASKGMSKVLAGEVAKFSQAIGSDVGRWWGVYFRGAIPWGEFWDAVLDDIKAKELLRMFRKHAGIVGRSYNTLTVFLNASYWKECLPNLLYPDSYNHRRGELRSEFFER